jgi:hypothetical protein
VNPGSSVVEIFFQRATEFFRLAGRQRAGSLPDDFRFAERLALKDFSN